MSIKRKLIDSINRTVDEFQTLGAEEIADNILNDVINKQLQNDLNFLQEMSNHLQPARERDKVSFDYLSEMIDDWIEEINEKL